MRAASGGQGARGQAGATLAGAEFVQQFFEPVQRERLGLVPIETSIESATTILRHRIAGQRDERHRLKSVESRRVDRHQIAARADRSGFFCCPHTGVALAAAEKLAKRGEISAGQKVVVISTANGLKFSEFKTQYHEGRLAGSQAPALANVPIELPREYSKVRETVIRFLDARD